MAELLVLAKTAEIKDAKWTRGDVIVVKPDGHEWGREERPPKFYVVKIPRAPVDDFRQYTEPQMVDTGILDFDGTQITRMEKPRKWQIELDRLPGDAKESLDRKGVTELSLIDSRSVITEKRTENGNRKA